MATPQKKIKLSPLIQVNTPGKVWGKGKLKVLTVNGVRISPGTSTQGALSQIVRQEMGTSYLARTIKNVDFSSVRMVNVAYHESRHDGFIDTEAFNLLKEQLKEHKDEFDAIIIWFSDIIRIGAKLEHVTELKDELSEISNNISVLTLKDSGKDLEEVAKIVAKYLQKRTEIGNGLGSHINAGSNLPRHPDFEDLATEIRRKKSEIISEANRDGKLDQVILDAAQRGETIKEISEDLKKVYGYCVKEIEKNSSPENVEKVAKQWIGEVQIYQSHHEVKDGKRVAMYLRTTDTTHELDEEYDEFFSDALDGRKYLGDDLSLPVAQASGNLAAMLCVGAGRGIDFSEATLLNDKRKSRWTIKRPSFMKLMTTLPSGSFKYLFMETMNRASGLRAQNLLLIKVCQILEMEIILAKNVGQAKQLPGDGAAPSWHVTANDVVDMDVARMEELAKALKTCKDKIGVVDATFSDCELLFKNLSNEDKVNMSKDLSKIGDGQIDKEKYKEIAEDIKEWFNKEDEEVIFSESSSEEEEEEYYDDSGDEYSEEEEESD